MPYGIDYILKPYFHGSCAAATPGYGLESALVMLRVRGVSQRMSRWTVAHSTRQCLHGGTTGRALRVLLLCQRTQQRPRGCVVKRS
ncbi:MAG: hypothetical protein [Cressdnaviricota sp.]|nr:MAG: hypothetical protein [Cressdnaviricota sp.]